MDKHLEKKLEEQSAIIMAKIGNFGTISKKKVEAVMKKSRLNRKQWEELEKVKVGAMDTDEYENILRSVKVHLYKKKICYQVEYNIKLGNIFRFRLYFLRFLSFHR